MNLDLAGGGWEPGRSAPAREGPAGGWQGGHGRPAGGGQGAGPPRWAPQGVPGLRHPAGLRVPLVNRVLLGLAGQAPWGPLWQGGAPNTAQGVWEPEFKPLLCHFGAGHRGASRGVSEGRVHQCEGDEEEGWSPSRREVLGVTRRGRTVGSERWPWSRRQGTAASSKVTHLLSWGWAESGPTSIPRNRPVPQLYSRTIRPGGWNQGVKYSIVRPQEALNP